MKVEIEFTESVLGTISGNKEIVEDFIASKNPNGVQQEEIESVEGLEDQLAKPSTFFARDRDSVPMLWDYQIKGFFKEACKQMIDTDTLTKEELKKVKLTDYLYKRTIDKQLFVTPRRIPLDLSGDLGFCERPLRGQTMRGERIALARSEEVPEGTKAVFEVIVLNEKLKQFIPRWLDSGSLSGIGQWRNSGKGRFKWRKIE